MEIVPILSTIILVGTVATFILAVAAYVLYKVRELRGNTAERVEQPQADPHVLMAVRQPGMMMPGGDSAPAEASMYMAPTGTLPPAGRYIEMNGPGNIGAGDRTGGQLLSSFFWEYTDDGFVPQSPSGGDGHAPSDDTEPGRA